MAKSEQELMKELFPQAYGKASAQNDGKVSNNNAAAANEQLNKGAGPMKVQPTKQQSPIADAITPNYGGAQKQATSAASAASAEVGLRNPQSNSGVNYRARISQLVPTGENENISILPKTEKKGFMFGGLKAQSESKKEPSRWVKGSYKRTPTVDSIGRSGTKIGRYKILSESEYENGGFSRGGSYDSYVRNVLGHIKSSSDKSESDGASKYLDEISRDEQGVKSVPLTKFGLMTEHEYKARGGKDYDRYINDETSKLKQTQGHELLHAIKQKVGGGYAELRSKSVSFIGMEKLGIIRDRYIDLYRELYSKNSFDEMTDAERADMWDMIDEEIMADIVGFVRDGDTESLMDIFGYSIESVSDILDTVNDILDEGRKGAPTENSNAVNYQAESDDNLKRNGDNLNGYEQSGKSNKLGRLENHAEDEGPSPVDSLGYVQQETSDTPHTKTIHRSGVSARALTSSGITAEQAATRRQNKFDGYIHLKGQFR